MIGYCFWPNHVQSSWRIKNTSVEISCEHQHPQQMGGLRTMKRMMRKRGVLWGWPTKDVEKVLWKSNASWVCSSQYGYPKPPCFSPVQNLGMCGENCGWPAFLGQIHMGLYGQPCSPLNDDGKYDHTLHVYIYICIYIYVIYNPLVNEHRSGKSPILSGNHFLQQPSARGYGDLPEGSRGYPNSNVSCIWCLSTHICHKCYIHDIDINVIICLYTHIPTCHLCHVALRDGDLAVTGMVV